MIEKRLLLQSAEKIVKECLSLRPREYYLVVADYLNEIVATALVERGLAKGAEAITLLM